MKHLLFSCLFPAFFAGCAICCILSSCDRDDIHDLSLKGGDLAHFLADNGNAALADAYRENQETGGSYFKMFHSRPFGAAAGLSLFSYRITDDVVNDFAALDSAIILSKGADGLVERSRDIKDIIQDKFQHGTTSTFKYGKDNYAAANIDTSIFFPSELIVSKPVEKSFSPLGITDSIIWNETGQGTMYIILYAESDWPRFQQLGKPFIKIIETADNGSYVLTENDFSGLPQNKAFKIYMLRSNQLLVNDKVAPSKKHLVVTSAIASGIFTYEN